MLGIEKPIFEFGLVALKLYNNFFFKIKPKKCSARTGLEVHQKEQVQAQPAYINNNKTHIN